MILNAHNKFILQAEKEGHNINSSETGEIEIEQYSAMKTLAQKAGLPVKIMIKKS